jgi:hypothetical protein
LAIRAKEDLVILLVKKENTEEEKGEKESKENIEKSEENIEERDREEGGIESYSEEYLKLSYLIL